MKKIFNIFSAALAAAFMVASCDLYQPEVDTWQPGEKDVEGCYGVYFPSQDFSEYQYLNPTAPCEVEMKIARSVSTGQITVPITVTASEAGIFDIPAVTFADGQSEASFTVTFDKAATGTKYTLSLAVTDPQYVSTYGNMPNFLDFSVMRVEWKYVLNEAGEKAFFTFDEMPFWEEIHTGYVKYYEIDGVRYCVTETDPVDGGFGFWGNATAQGEGEVSFEWYPNVKTAAGNQAILVKNCPVWFASNYGEMVYRWDWYEYWTIFKPQTALAGVTFPQFVKDYSSNYPVSYYDGNGIFVFHCASYSISQGNFESDIDDVFLIADGFTRVDYSLDMETGYSYQGELPVYFKAGADVAAIKVSAAAGELDAAGVTEIKAGIIDGSIESLDVDMEDLAIGLSFEETGIYTVVAVAFDESGNAQNSAYTYATYVAGDDDTHEVVFSVGLEPVSKRYEPTYTVYNSLGYWISGADIVEAKIGLYKVSDVKKYGTQVILSDLLSTDSVPGNIVEEVNAVGGYASVFSRLADGVDYALFVWATNGYKEDVKIAQCSTEKIPEVFESIGTCQITEAAVLPLFSVKPITMDVEIQESTTNPGKYKLIYPYGPNFPFNDPGDWDDSKSYDVIVNAMDPDHVYIEEQEIGIDYGYGMMSIVTNAARYLAAGYSIQVIEANGIEFAKLKDGVITFGVKGVLINMGGKYYNADANGDYKIVLPSKKASSSLSSPVLFEHSSSRVIDSAVTSEKAGFRCGFATGIKAERNEVKPVPVKGYKIEGKKKGNVERTFKRISTDREETIKK